MIRSLILALVLAGCSKKSDESPRALPPAGSEGTRCDGYACNKPLVCAPKSNVCVKPDHPELIALREEQRAADKAFLAQSGVPETATAESPPPSAAAPPRADAVRVVKVENKGASSFAFAACTADERLIGGSCVIDENVISTVEAYPSDHGATDTIGARWNCGRKTPYKRRLIAYALCQRVASP